VKTADNRVSMTFLSPQGLPVYSLTLDNKGLRVSRQMHTGELIDPVEILQYLELARLPEGHIGTQIGAEWSTQATDNKTVFTRLGTTTIDSESVTIEHTGKTTVVSIYDISQHDERHGDCAHHSGGLHCFT